MFLFVNIHNSNLSRFLSKGFGGRCCAESVRLRVRFEVLEILETLHYSSAGLDVSGRLGPLRCDEYRYLYVRTV